MSHILTLTDAAHSYYSLSGETKTLTEINFSVEEGEFLCIVGPSGCGKSTLLSIIAGLIPCTSGEVHFSGKRMGYMLQQDQLFEWRTIRENVLLGLEINHMTQKNFLGFVDRLLVEYGLWDFQHKYPSELSGGMRQRAALIRTLVCHPDLLLLDEPFSALDYQTRLFVCDDIYKIIRKEKKTAILVTHDLSEAVSIGGRILVLSKRPGRIRSVHHFTYPDAATPAEIRRTPEFMDNFNLLWEELRDDSTNNTKTA